MSVKGGMKGSNVLTDTEKIHMYSIVCDERLTHLCSDSRVAWLCGLAWDHSWLVTLKPTLSNKT